MVANSGTVFRAASEKENSPTVLLLTICNNPAFILRVTHNAVAGMGVLYPQLEPR